MNNKVETVYFQEEGILKINEYIKKSIPSKIIFLLDENTKKFCYPKVLDDLKLDTYFEAIEIKSGEKNKNLKTCYQIWSKLAHFEIDRNALMINLGGGVITDIGGFIASTYMRGIKFINIPTTLLAMADASIGGKNGVDLSFLKNLVGTFSCSEMVLIHSKYLETLNKKHLKSGFAEILKHSLIADKNQWNELKKVNYNEINNLEKFLPKTIRIKSNIVKLDFKEKNIRKILNFGHTIGHALESFFLKSQVSIFHGEALAMGILAESFIANKINLISKSDFLEIQEFLLKIYTIYKFSESNFKFLFSTMKRDKKNKFSKFQFSLINSIGNGVFNQEIERDKIIESFYYLISLQ